MLKKEKGITLIALIITIIVMLILVGVTINVVLNGGLFEKGEKAAFQTGASTVKEQLEMAKALKLMNAEEKVVEDYSDIEVGELEGLDQETIRKFANKIIVSKNGDICYNPETVTDSQERTWLEEIGINAYEDTEIDVPEGGDDEPEIDIPGGDEPTTQTGYSFTLNELGTFRGTADSCIEFDNTNVWNAIGKDLSEDDEYAYYMDDDLTLFALEPSDELFQDYVKVLMLKSEELRESTKFLIRAEIYLGDFQIYVTNGGNGDFITNTPGENQMTASQFIEAYGDVEFTFVKLSELGITTE